MRFEFQTSPGIYSHGLEWQTGFNGGSTLG